MEDRFLRASVPLSIAFHGLLVGLLALWIALKPAAPVRRPPVIIEMTDSAQKRQPKIQNRVVESTQGRISERAAEDAFLGEKTRIVERQTVTSQTRKLGQEAKPRPKQETAQKRKNQAPGKEGTDQGVRALGRLGVPILPLPGATAQKQADTPQWAPVSEDPLDFVKGVKKGDYTALNTKEFVYHGYFTRIRTLLDRAWEGELINRIRKLYRSGRRLASDRDHLTRTVVTLDRKGDVIKVEIIEESGVTELDETTVRAFNDAGPFPNPPAGLVGDDGLVKIRWDFVLRT